MVSQLVLFSKHLVRMELKTKSPPGVWDINSNDFLFCSCLKMFKMSAAAVIRAHCLEIIGQYFFFAPVKGIFMLLLIKT